MERVVWDWNGTLFDDLHVVIAAVNQGIGSLGREPITLDDYRDHYTRPVKVFYDRLFERSISEDEWRTLDQRFHDGYRQLLTGASLRADALAALEYVSGRRIRQSLLSMFPHEELVPLVERLGVAGFFERIDGLVGEPGGAKATYLKSHLGLLIGDTDPRRVLVVGDTPDDAIAAAHVGAQCVLVESGGHHRPELESLGVRVVGSLLEAVSQL
jgi:phosphoglycolate phosphatase-like HAD superfamily hydrolase